MAPKAMKAAAMKAKGKAMTKGSLAEALAGASELKKSQVTKVLGTLAEIAGKEVKSNGVFTIPGVCRIKTRRKAATPAGKRVMFGKEVVVKAKPAKVVMKAFPVAALKATL